MATPLEEPSSPTVHIEISDIRIIGLQDKLVDPDTQIQITAHKDSFHTKSIRSATPRWPDVLKFTIPRTSVVELRVVRKHTFGSPDILGHVVLTSEEHLTVTTEKEIGPLLIAAHADHPRNPCESLQLKLKVTAAEVASAKQQHALDSIQDDITRIHGSSKVMDAAGKMVALSEVSVDESFTNIGSEVGTTLLRATGYLDKWMGVMNQIAQITPYSSAAMSVLKMAYDAWKAQQERDAKIVELSKSLAELWEFMTQDPALEKVKALQKTVTGMLQQTEECAKFIRDYASATNAGIRFAKNFLKSNDGTISEFQQCFATLKVDYLNGINIATIVTLTQMSDKLTLMAETLNRLEAQTAPQPAQAIAAAIVSEPIVARPLRLTLQGRGEYISSIIESLSKNKQAWIPILGPIGIGKSSIALAIVNHATTIQVYGNRRHFIPCDAITPPTSSQFVELAAKHFGVTVYGTNPLEDLIRGLRTQSQTSCILALDNFEVLWDLKSIRPQVKVVLDRLAEIPSLALVITMRGLVPPDEVEWSFEPEEVPKLSLEAGRALFCDKYPIKDSQDQLDALLSELGFVPLPIKLQASIGKANRLTPQQLLDKWRAEHAISSPELTGGSLAGFPGASPSSSAQLPSSPTAPSESKAHSSRERSKSSAPILPARADIHRSDPGPSPPGNVLSDVDNSIQALVQSEALTSNPDALQLLSAVALLPNGAQRSRLPELVPNIKDLDAAIEVLDSIDLVTQDDHGGLHLLPPIRAYVLKHNSPDASLRLNIYSSYYRLALECSEAVDKNAVPSILTKLAPEQANFEVILELSLKERGDMASIQAAICYTYFLQFTRAKTTFIKLAADAARKGSASDLLAYCLQRLGEICYVQDRYEEGQDALEEAREEFLKAGKAEPAAQCLLTLGNIDRMRGRGRDARKKFEKAQSEFKAIGSKSGAGQCLRRLGEMQYMDNDDNESYEEAKKKLEEARQEFITAGDRRGALQCLHTIGRIEFVGQSRYEEGRPKMDEALKGFVEIGDRLGEAQVLQNLGKGLNRQAKYEEAAEVVERARQAFVQVGDRVGEAQCLDTLSGLLEGDEAEAKAEEAKKIWDDIRRGKAEATA